MYQDIRWKALKRLMEVHRGRFFRNAREEKNAGEK